MRGEQPCGRSARAAAQDGRTEPAALSLGLPQPASSWRETTGEKNTAGGSNCLGQTVPCPKSQNLSSCLAQIPNQGEINCYTGDLHELMQTADELWSKGLLVLPPLLLYMKGIFVSGLSTKIVYFLKA